MNKNIEFDPAFCIRFSAVTAAITLVLICAAVPILWNKLWIPASYLRETTMEEAVFIWETQTESTLEYVLTSVVPLVTAFNRLGMLLGVCTIVSVPRFRRQLRIRLILAEILIFCLSLCVWYYYNRYIAEFYRFVMVLIPDAIVCFLYLLTISKRILIPKSNVSGSVSQRQNDEKAVPHDENT